MMCFPWEPKSKAGKGIVRRSEWKNNICIIVIMRRPSHASFSDSLAARNELAYAETVILVVQADKLMQNCINAFGSTQSQSTRQAGGWCIYLWSLCIQCQLLSTPTTGTTCLSVPSWGIAVFCCSEQTPYAPQLGSTAQFLLSVVQPTDKAWFWEELRLSKLLFSNNYFRPTLDPVLKTPHSDGPPRYQQVPVRKQG